jgi:small GTP-binding protein
MPTNLPPDYFEVEKRFRAASSVEEKIATLEELISTVPKHKGTDHLRADLRRRLAELRKSAKSQKRTGRQASVYNIDREGAGQVAIVGPPNVGKSALLASVTNAKPQVADYPFTTWTPTPGMMPYLDIQIQLIDTPPLNDEYIEPQLMDLIRRADLILLMVDLQGYPIEQIETSAELMRQHRIVPLHQRDVAAEEQGAFFIPTLVVVNKVDDETLDEDYQVLEELLGEEWPMIPISVTNERNIDRLKEAVFKKLGVIRVYSKPPGQKPDLGEPYVIKEGSTVQELAGKVHKDFLENLTAARIWGSAAHDGQMVGRDHVLSDGDIIELRI